MSIIRNHRLYFIRADMKPFSLLPRKKTFFLTVVAGFLLMGCSAEPYPQAIQAELLSICKNGISSGMTVVHHGKDKELTESDINQLCQFRLSEFMKQVSLDKYLTLNKNIYLNFARAYSHKYILKDIYDTLSPDDKHTNAKIATILLGLEGNNAK